VSLESELRRTSPFGVEQLPDDEVVQTIEDPSGTVTTVRGETDGSSARTSPDGTVTRTGKEADPHLSFESPVASKVEVTTPGGRLLTVERSRETSLGDPADPLSLVSMRETTSRNGLMPESVFDAALLRHTFTSAGARVSTVGVDELGRALRAPTPGIEPIITAYDDRGRPSVVRQGARETEYGYDQRGWLAELTDALDRTTGFEYDGADRLPPPSRPTHAFSFTALDQTEPYTPPDLGAGPEPTTYSYNADRQVTAIERPGGERIELRYDDAGRLSTTTQAGGVTSLEYDADTGQLAAATAPGGERIEYSYDGIAP
jgi:YD repeat-containing protein